MAIKVYGIVQSRALRTLWMLEELGLPYEHVKTSFRNGGCRTQEHLKINPNGHIPVLQDDGTTLFESMAINLYLAMKYNKGLWPASVEDQGRAVQWSFWAMTELEPHLLQALLNRVFFPAEKRDEARAATALETVQGGAFRVLEGALAGRSYLVGDRFSVADLNVAALMTWAKATRANLTPHPNVSRWLEASLARSSYQAALARG